MKYLALLFFLCLPAPARADCPPIPELPDIEPELLRTYETPEIPDYIPPAEPMDDQQQYDFIEVSPEFE